MKTVLLIEDSKFLRVASERLLVKEGYRLLCACDGEEALVIARDNLPDLIILDMLLPKLGGLEVLRLLKSGISTNHIPVIVLSAMSQKNEQKLKHDGATLFLEKGLLLNNSQAFLDAIHEGFGNIARVSRPADHSA